MLKKLRLKFIFVIMSIVTIMIVCIFSLLYYFASDNMERESYQMMRSISSHPFRTGPPGSHDEEKHDVNLPYFSILVNNDGETLGIGGGYFDLSDEDLLNELLSRVKEQEEDIGVLKEYNLRFLKSDSPNGQCVVFSDMSLEQSTLNSLLKISIVIGSLTFLVFLGISFLLARWAIKPVENAWLQQKQFVADASHELKTPLTVIMTDAELLHSPVCSEDDRLSISDSIIKMSGQMRGLVESLLELARLDNSSISSKLEAVSFSDIVSNQAMIFEPIFFEKDLVFEYEIDSDIMLNGNSSQLNQLTGILLDNAIKYSQANGKTILKLKAASHKRCMLTVSNQGDPISDEDIKNIFKRFYRADKARSLNHSYGLGLSIASNIADNHHGKIWAESKDGYNSFYVEL